MEPLRRLNPQSKWLTVPCAVLLAVGLSVGDSAGVLPSFGSGERLTFDVYYGPIKAGRAQMEVGSMRTLRGRECLLLSSTARSGSLVSAFFPVEDRVESWLDLDELRPLRFEKHLREGSYQCDRVMDYYYDEGVARSEDGTVGITDRTQDALSSLYWVRTLDLEPGTSFQLTSTASRSVYDLKVDVTRREHLKTPAGEFDCILVEPHVAKDGGIFDNKGRIWIWLTDDVLHLPVQMVTQVAIGSIKAVLVDHTLGSVATAEPTE